MLSQPLLICLQLSGCNRASESMSVPGHVTRLSLQCWHRCSMRDAHRGDTGVKWLWPLKEHLPHHSGLLNFWRVQSLSQGQAEGSNKASLSSWWVTKTSACVSHYLYLSFQSHTSCDEQMFIHHSGSSLAVSLHFWSSYELWSDFVCQLTLDVVKSRERGSYKSLSGLYPKLDFLIIFVIIFKIFAIPYWILVFIYK